MGLPAYLVTNLLDANATLTPGTEDSSYPVENLYGLVAANRYRSLSLLSLSVLVDLGSSKAANTIALINHNATSGATITVKAGGSSPPSTVVATLSWRQYDIWADLGSQTARYWLLEISDSNTVALSLGQLVLGTRVALPESFRRGRKPSVKTNNIALETEAGVRYVYPRYKRNQPGYVFRVRTSGDLASMRTWYNATNGEVTPFVFLEDVSLSGMLYCRMQADWDPAELSAKKDSYDVPVNLVEESRGLELT